MDFKTLERLFQMIFIFSGCFSPTIFAGSLQSNDTKRSLEKEFLHVQVLILGAGIAGITAAKTLHDRKFYDFLVLEGTERIGGRLFKKDFQGGVIELGANWVHGIVNNPIWKLVQNAKLNSYETMIAPTNSKYIVLDKNGAEVTTQDDHLGFQDKEECLEKNKKIRQSIKADDISVRQGLYECDWLPKHPAQTVIEYYNYDFDAAAPPEEISCGVKLRSANPSQGEIDSTGGRQFLVSDPKGYESIINNMATDFEGKVFRNHEVKKIERKGDFVEVEVETVSPFKTIKADYVLVTFSVGVLRKQIEMNNVFSPPLPVPFQQSLLKMRMANYLKIFLKFSQRFWPENFDYIFYASEERGFYPVWQNLPGKATDIPENDNILLVTVTGKKACELKENKRQIETELLPVLEKVFEPKEKPKLTGIELKNWGEDPFFLGAYSNPTVGTTSEDFDNLLKPVDDRLYFAGEGLSELYFGYAHGAYRTGERQANTILNRITKQYQSNVNRMTTVQNHATLGLSYVLRKNIGKPGNKTVP